MPTDLTLRVTPSDLAQVVESVFESMIGLALTQTCAPWLPGEDRVTSAVHMTGEWSGAVMLECDRGQACRFAGRFLSTDPPESMDEVVRDLLGELTNMIGGNLKCMLAPGIQLSMPTVVDGGDYSMRICGQAERERLAFESSEGLIWVSVVALQA